MTQKDNRFDESVSLESENLQLQLEALIFSSSQGISLNEIKKILKIENSIIIKNLIKQINQIYIKNNSVLRISFDGKKFRHELLDSLLDHPIIQPFTAGSDMSLSQIKTLAFVAYNQPVEFQDIVDFVGRGSKKALENLVHRNFLSFYIEKYTILNEKGKEKSFV